METDRISDEEISLWLAFESLKGIGMGAQKIIRLYDRFRGIKPAWEASKNDLILVAGMQADAADQLVKHRRDTDPEKLLQNAREKGVTCLAYSDPLYPADLRQIHDPPVVLFVRGEIKENDFNNLVAVVGSRRPTSYGQKTAKDIARGLSSNGVTVVSGLALGIDSLAHWGAIEGAGRTIAVVGTGPDLCYPSSNRRLYQSILDGNGIVMSEYYPGTTAEKWHFPARNRIISGVSRSVVVVEAAEFSGALITAKLAFEQNRDVFAIPGRIDSPLSAGTNGLIRKQYAQLATGHQEILDALSWVSTEGNHVRTIVELYGREKDIYESLSNEPVQFDVLCQRSDMPPGEMSATLTMLELAGLVTRHPGDWYSKEDNRSSGVIPSIPTASEI